MQFSGRSTPRLIGAIVGLTLALGVFAWMRGREVEIKQVTGPPAQKGSPHAGSAKGPELIASAAPNSRVAATPSPTSEPTPEPVAVPPTPRSEFPDPARPRRKIEFVGTLYVRQTGANPPAPDFAGVVVRAPAYKVEAFPSESGEFTMLLDLPSTQNHVRLEVDWEGMIFADIAEPPAFGKPYLIVQLDPESGLTRAKIEMKRVD